jgi:hypothetical protein
MTVLLVILVTHFIADFIVQTDWQAKNKSKRLDALTLHLATYSLCLAVPLVWMAPWRSALYYVALNALAHWVTDFFTSRATSWAYPRLTEKVWGPVSGNAVFWAVIGFDQFAHQAVLILTLPVLR